MGRTAYEQARREARRRWVQNYTAEQDELSRLRAATNINGGTIAHNRGPRDSDKFIYAFKDGKVQRRQSRHGLSRRSWSTQRHGTAGITASRSPAR